MRFTLEDHNSGRQNYTTMSCITSAEYLPARRLSLSILDVRKILYQNAIWRVHSLRLLLVPITVSIRIQASSMIEEIT